MFISLKKRIKKEAQLIKIQTELGTAVSVTKKECYRWLDILEQRGVEPVISWNELWGGKYLVIFMRGEEND